jgi:hypothetical protein
MSLTSYRAAPPRVMTSAPGLARIFLLCRSAVASAPCGPAGLLDPICLCASNAYGPRQRPFQGFGVKPSLCREDCFSFAFSRPGSDLLSRVLRRSTIGAGAFHGRVRNGNGCSHPARTTRSAKGKCSCRRHDHLSLSCFGNPVLLAWSASQVPKRPYGDV